MYPRFRHAGISGSLQNLRRRRTKRTWAAVVAVVTALGCVTAAAFVVTAGHHAPGAGTLINSIAKSSGTALHRSGDNDGTPRPDPDSPTPTSTPGGSGSTPTPTPTPTPTSTPTSTPGGSGAGLVSGLVTACGTKLCVNGHVWYMDGASVYNPGLRPPQSGILNPAGTVALAEAANLDTVRIINFYNNKGDPAVEPYNESRWVLVDKLIAAAGAAGLHIDLGLGDYRNTLWRSCINPYTYDWTHFINFVANRVNTATGAVYKNDPTIAFVSIAGEPLAANKPHTGVTATGTSDPNLVNCTIQYSTQQLTAFYTNTTGAWKAQGGSVMVSNGGLGYINEYQSAGIDWKAICGLASVDVCGIKTYGGMFAFAPTVATWTASINKPMIDEEFGYKQSMGDGARAALFASQFTQLRNIGAAGVCFWNLGFQVGGGSYEVSPLTPLTFDAVRHAAG